MAAFENGKWQAVPGAASARWIPFIRAPDLLRSNSFVLDLPGAVIVIDPACGGAGPDAAGANAAVIEALAAGTKPVIGVLTHIHIDHSMQAGAFRDRLKPHARALLAVHECGRGLIEAGDSESTLAELYGRPMPSLEIDLCIRSSAPGSALLVLALPGHGGRPQPIAGPGRNLEIYHTPGHSPDSICLRAGRLLFSGDVLFALNPFVAGIKGWSREDLTRSIPLILRVIEEHGVEWLLPGHGGPIAAADAKKLLASAMAKARKMSSVAGVTRQRVEEAGEYANELLVEMELVFTGIAGRLLRAAHYLDEIGEPGAADRIRGLLDSDALDALLDALRGASEKVRCGERLDICLVHDAILSARKALKIISGSAIDRLIPGFFLKRANNALKDFLTYVSGLERPAALEKIELNAAVQGVLEELREPARYSDEGLLSLDDAGFISALAERMAHVPTFEGKAVEIEPGRVPAFGLADAERFRDSLACLVQDLFAAGADRIAIGCRAGAEGAIVTLEAPGCRAHSDKGANRLAAHIRRFAMAGVALKSGLHCRAPRLVLTMQAAPAS